MDDDYRTELRDKIAEAKRHPAASIVSLLPTTDFRTSGKGIHTARLCPFCHSKRTFWTRDTGDGWKYGCFKTSCAANTKGDVIEFLKLDRGIDNRAAIHALLNLAGIEHPWDRIQRERDAARREGGRP